jgi:hypothetical protein
MGVDCYVDFLNEVPFDSLIKKDTRALNGALLSTCQSGVGRRILMENRDKQDSIRLWCQMVQKYETDNNTYVRIKRLESVINTVFHLNYRFMFHLSGMSNDKEGADTHEIWTNPTQNSRI